MPPLVEHIARVANAQVIKSFLHFILPQLLDRLGDGRMAVRELALSILMTMWAEFNGMQNKVQLSVDSQSPTRPSGPRYSGVASSIPKLTAPLRPRIISSQTAISPPAQQWNPAITFERDMQTRGFGHKTWRVREMVLEWLIACVQQYSEFPAARYIDNTFSLLDDTQDAVRFAAKRALNTIYHARTELQEDIITRAQSITPYRPNLLAAITAPPGELAMAPSSPFGGTRSSSRLGSSHSTRPGSRAFGQRTDSRLGAPPPFSQIPSVGAFRASNRSISQQGYRPGSRAGGYSSPLSPSRGMYHQQTSPLHSHIAVPPLPNNGDRSLSPANSSSQSMQPPHLVSSLNSRSSSNIIGSRRPLQRQPSQSRLVETFVPGQNIPPGVNIHNVPSKSSLAAEFSRTAGFFAGRETESNWIQREKAISLYRGTIWGNAATEFSEDLASLLKENIHEILKAVSSLRTSLSTCALGLCEDIAVRLGPHANTASDVIIDAILKQCTQTKKIGAQRAARSLEVVFQHFPLRAKGIDMLKQRMPDKSANLRQAVASTCIGILRNHRSHLGSPDRRSAEILAGIEDIVKVGIQDAQPSVREVSRELFWELYTTSTLHAKKLLSGFPESIRAALDRDKVKYIQNGYNNGQIHSALPDNRPMSAASVFRSSSESHGRQMPLRPSFSSSRESMVPSLMSMVSTSSPQRSPTTARSSISNDIQANPSVHFVNCADMQPLMSLHNARLDELDETEPVASINSKDNDGSIIFAEPRIPQPHRAHIKGLETPVKARMSLGLIDFSKMDTSKSLADITAPSGRELAKKELCSVIDMDQDIDMLNQDNQVIASDTVGESQATAVMVEEAICEVETTIPDISFQADNNNGGAMSIDEQIDKTSMAENNSDAFNSKGLSSKEQTITPEHTPRMSPRLRADSERLSTAFAAMKTGQIMATPRTQTARYWHGPMEPALPGSIISRQPVVDSPMPAEISHRLTKVEGYLARLADNNDVDESLFRSLARFAKEESSGVWLDEENGGQGYLGRILTACLIWLQNPAESRDTVFTKDSCFDVLRVLVRRKSQHFTLDNSRLLLLEVLRNRFFESTILSGSAEDVFYDIAAHLDVDLCLELSEDFFKRAPLPPMQYLVSQKPGYATHLEPLVPTPIEMDPMGVFKMDNALAGMLEFVSEVVKRLSSSAIITEQELDKFMPYSVVCFVHPRSQVRKAALAPLIAVHEKSGAPDAELEDMLLRAGLEQLASSVNPLAKYVSQLHRPELRRLAWTFYISKRDA
ncbi:clasp N terminal-domain-containing protein [Coemansia spiralis]|nr:clasp N terminal-domain-containing protein [Coemansia spiralis]